MKGNLVLLFAIGILLFTSCGNNNEVVLKNGISIQLDNTTTSLVVGGSQKLIYNIDPINPVWLSTDTTIAKVNSVGIITAISVGKASVTVRGDNNFSAKCDVNVVSSPVSSLVIPNYPITNGSTFIIEGKGFKKEDKIWLRKIEGSSKSSKIKKQNSSVNTSQSNDFLATIHEVAENFISLSAGVSDGWYYVILNSDSTTYNLGSLQFNTKVFPEYTYDKTKIFWEDTHWRRFQLRGKVKSMTTTDAYYPYWTTAHAYNFNKNGYLESFAQIPNDGSLHGYTTYQYDNNNKLIKKSKHSDSNPSSTGNVEEFIYGSHSMYVQSSIFNVVDSDFQPEYYNSFYYGIGAVDHTMNSDLEMWLKGLTGIKFYSTGYSCTLDITSNTVSYTYTGSKQIDKTTYYYQGNFPYKSTENSIDVTTGQKSYRDSCTYEFSSTGMRQKKIDTYYSKSYTSDWITNCPFNLYKTYEDYGFKFSYDKNWDMTTFFDGYQTVTFYYASYDEYGNWTECTVVEDDGTSKTIEKLSRKFTYW